ncbi:MAG: aspartyl protease family protein [bacterium]
MIEFQFEKRHTQRLGEIFKPIVPVTLIGPKRSLNIFMLLDSGADLSLIPYSVGETIGLELDIEHRSEVQGIGEGSVSYILSEAKLKIENIEISARVAWALIEEVPFILGRLDVFQNFSVEFREFENKIILKQLNELIQTQQKNK